jgi:non-specific serine/threonine protein kinase/serine/threonine-protein kinase
VDTRPDTSTTSTRLEPDERARLIAFLAEQAQPQRFGAFRIIGTLGRGGMGTVFEAEQDHPRRRVALKVIRPGVLSRAMLRRFEYEADVLARLEHPGIARVYEAGVADAGLGPQPYFAMELVEGKRLDEYVRGANPPLRQRLALLIDICRAVHHAHTRGVIHRDLKPANILVDAQGKPKVLDFGVARAIESGIDLRTSIATEVGQLVGTLPYMSPEQASGRVDQLDTSCDVYALGVIAYELLSGGRMPYSVDGRTLVDAVRIICETEPSRLSSIDRSLRGDVETIIGKALEKDKSRRYTTAGELAADVKRHLDYEPITARAPTRWYRFAKFARRNKLAVGAIAAIFIVLLAGATVSTVLALREARQRAIAQDKQREAEAVVEFLTEDVLAAATPQRARDAALSDALVRVMLEPAAASVGKRFGDRPLLEAAVRDALASCYYALARFDLGLPHAQRALEQRRWLLGEDHPQTLVSLNTVAGLLLESGRLDEAEPMLRDLLSRRTRALGAEHPHTLEAQAHLAELLYHRDALDESERVNRATLDARRRSLGSDHIDTIASLNNLARVLAERGKLDEAETLYRQALATGRRTLGEDHPYTLGLLSNLASLVAAQGDHAEAETLERDVVARRRRVLGDDHRDTITSINNLAVFFYNRGKLDEAEPLLRELPAAYTRVLGPQHPQTLTSLSNLGAMLQNRGKLENAAEAFAELYRRSQAAPIEPSRRAEFAALYGACLVKLKRYADAEQPLREALPQLPADIAPGIVSDVYRGLAIVCENSNRAEEAQAWRAALLKWQATTRPATQAS